MEISGSKYKIGDFIDKTHRVENVERKRKGKNSFAYYYDIVCVECNTHRIIRQDVIVTEFKKNNNQLSPCKECNKLKPLKKGEKINNYLILEDYYIKVFNGGKKERRYKVQCLKCGHIEEKTEFAIRHNKQCQICCGREVEKGINDIYTLYPDFADLFWNKDEAKEHGVSSIKKVYFKCPDCGSKIGPFQIRIIWTQKRLTCPICGDNVSYPEKFFYNFLKEMNINFVYQYIPKWSNKKRYDFFIEEYNLIVETDGEQHKKNNFYLDKSVNCIKENDKQKEFCAFNNGIKNYIHLDCSRSELNFIKKQILSNDLLMSFLDKNKLLKLDWGKISYNALTSHSKRIIELWNEGERDVDKITEQVIFKRATVVIYLVRASKNKLLNFPYIPKNYSKDLKEQIFQEYGITKEEWKEKGFDKDREKRIKEICSKNAKQNWRKRK